MSDETVTLRDYTEAFKVKKALRKIGKANVPLKEGLFVDDIKVFALTLVLWITAYNMILAPPIKVVAHLFGTKAPVGIPYLFILFVPPIFAVALSRRPVRHNLGIFGLIRALIRDWMDDPVHRKGVPVRKGHGAAAYRIVVWRARTDLLPGLAPTTPLPNGFAAVPVPPPAAEQDSPATSARKA
ncbi:hypothetical protein GCM10011579_039780 [Streptomyces albiflavescens]|uniref:TcpE family protein n=1 Tax=Streptomyces albiflavescens TaxID=1623582 RepID=A0A918D5F7_9ACTN|nr:hypothetical protein [Streptomyces albiflavescens]GGN67344.1 hypothetical protein GCM10011579_039780 [Streptomyces albiflavescens]